MNTEILRQISTLRYYKNKHILTQKELQDAERHRIMKEWYINRYVQEKIVQYTKNRESAILISKADNDANKGVNTRYLSINKTVDISFQLQNAFKLYTDTPRLYNLYYSLALYTSSFPFFVKYSISKSDIV